MPQRWSPQLAVLFFMLWGCFLFSPPGAARSFPDEYYTVSDNAVEPSEPPLDPVEILEEMAEQARTFFILDLMSWVHHQERLDPPQVPYNRKFHYGSWVLDPRDGTCLNTRAKVLIRSSEIPVRMNSRGCAVVTGRWRDPYSNRYFEEARDLQIDHVVPLKNSYISGAWKWESDKRCLYANFLGNMFHLLAVNGPDNMRKGDRTPEGFMPPNPAYACEYLVNWLKIKLIWKLAMVPSEAQAISELVNENHCDPEILSMSFQELNHQRNQILENRELCSASH